MNICTSKLLTEWLLYVHRKKWIENMWKTGRRLRFSTINIHLSIMSPSFCKFNFLSWIESKMAACWLHDFQSSKRYLKRWFVAYIDVDIQRRNIWFADQIIIFRKKKKFVYKSNKFRNFYSTLWYLKKIHKYNKFIKKI